MKLTRKPWSTTPAFIEPKHPGPDGTIGQHLEYGRAMMAIAHLRPGYLPQGTRVKLRDGSLGMVNHFIPYDGYQIGVRTDADKHSGLITLRKELTVCPTQPQTRI